MRSNTTASFNTATGFASLYSNTTGINNTAAGVSALYANISGSNNVGIGFNVAQNAAVTASQQCVYVGASIAPTANYSNAIGLGYGITNAQLASNKVRIGNAAITVCEVPVVWTVSSDKNIKSEIKYDVPGLELITKLQPATYFYKEHLTKHGDKAFRYNGLLAQDVDKILTDMGLVNSIVSKPNADGSGSWGIRYAELTLPLIKAVQELKNENDLLKAKVTELEAKTAKIDYLEAAIKELQNRAGVKAEK